jgi:excisionase family DNA binding protein
VDTASYDDPMKLMTIREAAEYLYVHENTLRRWCDHGVIPAFRLGSRGDQKLIKADVENLKKHYPYFIENI